MKRIIFLFLPIIFFFTSCKKNDTSNTELLTKEIWYINKVVEYTDNSITNTNDISGYSFNFKTDNTYEYTENYNSNPNISNGTWEFSSDETKIEINAGTDKSYTLTIVELTDNSLVYTQPTEDNNIIDKLYLSHNDN